jgi:hypothetical protein
MPYSKVKDKTSVPVPQVLAWSSNPESDSIGTGYIIMEHIPGVALNDVWGQMTKLQHMNFIERLGGFVKQLCALNFGAFGSLYLNTEHKPSNTHPIDGEYCIGPNCGRQFWGHNDDQTAQTAVPLGLQGPCELFIQSCCMSISADFTKGKACLPSSQISLI